jgi:hypothetical protein
MTTEPKTYSRARAAKAALVKLLEMHETEALDIHTQEVADGRWAAKALFADPITPELEADLVEQGVGFIAPPRPWEVDADEEPAAGPQTPEEEADCWGVEPVSEDPAPELDAPDIAAAIKADAEADEAVARMEAEALAVALPKVSGYIKEVSAEKGATKRVWAIADSMPGATRKEVVEACRKAGIAFGTARTQYQKWYSAKKSG